MLVAAMNPCPCGYLGDSRRACVCTGSHIHRYRSKISGPLADRIDIQIEVPPVTIRELSMDTQEETSEGIRARVTGARGVQGDGLQEEVYANGQMDLGGW